MCQEGKIEGEEGLMSEGLEAGRQADVRRTQQQLRRWRRQKKQNLRAAYFALWGLQRPWLSLLRR